MQTNNTHVLTLCVSVHSPKPNFDIEPGKPAKGVAVQQAAGDAVDTLPIDIMATDPPQDSMVLSPSPEISYMRRRTKYQERSRHGAPPRATRTLLVSL